MSKCNHMKGIIEGEPVFEKDWEDKRDAQIKAIDFWFKNIDNAVRYEIPEPRKLVIFGYCPLCGVEI